MSKVALAKSTLLAVVLVTVLVSSLISAGVTSLSLNPQISQDEQGPKGDTGETGPQGPKGDTGLTGAKGTQGDNGAQGSKGDKGDTGATGANGTQGPKGDTGAIWYNGTGVPQSILGINGDFYLNSINSDVYNKMNGSWVKVANIQGAVGATGSNGATWLSGIGVPSSSLGSNGDFYLNTATSDVYNKASGAWSKVANIQGATGAQGPYLPDYDSGWIDISNKAGQFITLNHNLNYSDILVDIIGRAAPNGSIHQKYLGLAGYTPDWSKAYAASVNEQANSIIKTSDDGFLIAGAARVAGNATAPKNDVYLVKIDSRGNTLWNKTFGGVNDDVGYSVIQTLDGGYAITGKTNSFGAGNYDVFLIKTDSSGNVQWNKTYGGSAFDEGYTVVQTGDSGYAIAGSSVSSGGGDFYLVKTDSNGVMQWNRTYGGSGLDYGRSLVNTKDGGYVIAGWGNSYGVGGSDDFYLVKTDSNGIMQWNKTYGGSMIDQAYCVIQTSDGGYALAGATIAPVTHNWVSYLIKTDSAGHLLWNKTYGGLHGDGAYSIIQASDGGYVMTGYTLTTVYTAGLSIAKTTSNGELLWNKTFLGDGRASGSCIIETSDGAYAAAGFTAITQNSAYNFFLAKTAVNGDLGIARVDSTANSVTFYRGTNDVDWNYLRVRIWKID